MTELGRLPLIPTVASRPPSPLQRIPLPGFEYCPNCECDTCTGVQTYGFCSKCAKTCCTDSKDRIYIPSKEEASGSKKRKQTVQDQSVLPISLKKRFKRGSSVSDSIKATVNKELSRLWGQRPVYLMESRVFAWSPGKVGMPPASKPVTSCQEHYPKKMFIIVVFQ